MAASGRSGGLGAWGRLGFELEAFLSWRSSPISSRLLASCADLPSREAGGHPGEHPVTFFFLVSNLLALTLASLVLVLLDLEVFSLNFALTF